MKVEHGTLDIHNLSPQQVQQISYQNWLDDGHRNNEILYTLDAFIPPYDSVLVDLGGYEGKWASEIHKKYKFLSQLIIYEPVPSYYESLKTKFADDSRVIVYPFITSDYEGVSTIFINEASSSTQRREGIPLEIARVDLGQHLFEHLERVAVKKLEQRYIKEGVSALEPVPELTIDCMKINIEGDEFPVINSLYNHNRLKNIRNLLIQTHFYTKDPIEDYTRMYHQLSETHERVWNYPWIWEYWRLK